MSVPPQAYFVERIGGEHVRVEVMIPPGYSHVDYPLTPRQVAALSRARLYVAVGHPAFEFERIQLKPVLRDLPGIQVVDMSRGMRLLAGEGEGEEDEHGHTSRGGRSRTSGWRRTPWRWRPATSPPRWRGSIPPTPPSTGPTSRRFEAEIAALDREIRARLAGREGDRFMVYHPTWGYFAREYGLQQVAIEAEGKEPSAQRLIQLIERARRERIKVVFVQAGFPRKSAQVIAEAVGGRVLIADPQDPDWLGNLRRVARELQEALPHG